MNIDLTPIFQAVIALLAALVTYKLIPWIKSKTNEQQRNNLAAAARIAVYAAQQIYGADEEANNRKLEYAMKRVREAGFDLDVDAVREAVEHAVREMKWDEADLVLEEETVTEGEATVETDEQTE